LRNHTFNRFSRTPTCDRQTNRHTAYTALAWRRAVKTTKPKHKHKQTLIWKIYHSI